jgi:hypothetical protein
MPIRHTDKGWFWGSKGPFPTKQKAMQVGQAAYSRGYKGENNMEDNGYEIVDDYNVEECVMRLLNSATNTHVMHFQTKSYSIHKALENYYNEIVDLVDTFVEAYQGKFGIIENYPMDNELPTKEPLQYLIGLIDYLKEARPYLPQDTELQNILDEIASLLDSTLYKLRFLS